MLFLVASLPTILESALKVLSCCKTDISGKKREWWIRDVDVGDFIKLGADSVSKNKGPR